MQTPYFLWDYQLTENQVKALLRGENDTEKLWLIARILTHAKFSDVWKYLTVEEIIKVFPKLKLEPRIKEPWERAFNVWRHHV